jgi:hypothetical protein
MGELRAGTTATTAATPALAVGVFADEVRAEQALRALEVWRRANRGMGVGTLGVVARGVSGTVTWRVRGVLQPRRGALRGLLIGLVLFALPVAGAAWFAAWVVSSIVFGLASLVGAVPGSQVGTLVLATALGSAILAGGLFGAIGALLGCLVGLVAGLIDGQARGLSRAEVASTAAGLLPGTWATVARVQPPASSMVDEELARLGGVPPAPGPALEPAERS